MPGLALFTLAGESLWICRAIAVPPFEPTYFAKNPGALALPAAFMSKAWPGGSDQNPLFVEQRYGAGTTSGHANLASALTDTRFVGAFDSGSPGFGGVQTPFSHQGDREGWLEQQPHDHVHVDVGAGGLMSDPRTAALDPIFWLHHANIDRLW